MQGWVNLFWLSRKLYLHRSGTWPAEAIRRKRDMASVLQQFKEWIVLTVASIDFLTCALIGLVYGLIFRDKSSRIFVDPVLGFIGAVPGGLLLKWADLFPYSHFVGAFFGAFIVLGLKRGFRSEWL